MSSESNKLLSDAKRAKSHEEVKALRTSLAAAAAVEAGALVPLLLLGFVAADAAAALAAFRMARGKSVVEGTSASSPACIHSLK